SGDYAGALTLLNKRNEKYEPSADAQALAADIYEELGVYSLAADAWFRFLDVCNEADFSEGYEGLAVAFMNMGNDLHSSLYYHRYCSEEGNTVDVEALLGDEVQRAPYLKVVYSAAGEAPEVLAEGLALLKAGELEGAKEALSAIAEGSDDYPTAVGLSAMCTLMLGDEDGAEQTCRELLERYPDNVQALTTYCAVQGAKGNKAEAQETARRLSVLKTEATDDLYRIATALCETGLDEEAFEKLAQLRERLPNDDNVLYFLAVAAYRTGRTSEAVEALEWLTTLYPRKAVAAYYLERMRRLRDGLGEPFSMTYFYRLPEDEYNAVAGFFLAADAAVSDYELQRVGELPQLKEFFRLAFDEMEGRDEKLQMIAAKVAVKLRVDSVVREALLNYEGDDVVKIHLLHELVLRNEDDSFGTVICNLYKEFFTHKIDIGTRKEREFLEAFADVYSKFALLGEENERKICAAAEDVYAALEEYEAWECFDERASLAAAIYREARIRRGERSFEKIVRLFGANKFKTQEILNFLI
ncbi:MAG: tetratricopeptide repeat protein, partial [Clostridia bacterium]|nr:tetratricopeptide repeat protein [Clostridia bacterium]